MKVTLAVLFCIIGLIGFSQEKKELGIKFSEEIKENVILYLFDKEEVFCGQNIISIVIENQDPLLTVVTATGGAIILKDQEKGLWSFVPSCPNESYIIHVTQRSKIKQIKKLKEIVVFELPGLQ